MRWKIFGSVVLLMMVTHLAATESPTTSLDTGLRNIALESIGFNNKIEVCVHFNSTSGWEHVGGIPWESRPLVTAYLADFSRLVYIGGEGYDGGPKFKPTESFLSAARAEVNFFGFGGKNRCLPVAERVLGEITYVNKWTAKMDLGEQRMLAFTFTYSMRTLLGKPIDFGKFEGKAVMTLDPTDGKWKILSDPSGLQDNGIKTFVEYLDQIHPKTSVLPPSNGKLERNVSNRSGKSLPFRERIKQHIDPGKFPVRERTIKGSADLVWKATNRAIQESESYFNIHLSIGDSDRETGFLATQRAEKQGLNILLRVQVFCELESLGGDSTKVKILVASYDADRYPQQGPWIPESPYEVAKMAEQFLDNVERELKLTQFSDCKISSKKTNFTGNWTGSLVKMKDLASQECTLLFGPVSDDHGTGTLALADVQCTIQVLEKERSGSMVTFTMSTQSEATRKCRKFAKKHQLEVFPTKDGRIFIRIRKEKHDDVAAKALLQRTEAEDSVIQENDDPQILENQK